MHSNLKKKGFDKKIFPCPRVGRPRVGLRLGPWPETRPHGHIYLHEILCRQHQNFIAMKFGRQLHKYHIPLWAGSYLDYDGLKKLIKHARTESTERGEPLDCSG